MLITCVDAVQLNSTFLFAYAKSRFSHDAAHMELTEQTICGQRPRNAKCVFVCFQTIKTQTNLEWGVAQELPGLVTDWLNQGSC